MARHKPWNCRSPITRTLCRRRSGACRAYFLQKVNPERHEYELYLAIEDIDHSRTKTKSPQTNGICERFHKTVLNEFYRVAFRKKVYRSIDELQVDLDVWIRDYNEARPHQGRWCYGKTPMQTFLDAVPLTKEKMIAA
jgi:integrase-like protein